jgi:hypothetical protein
MSLGVPEHSLELGTDQCGGASGGWRPQVNTRTAAYLSCRALGCQAGDARVDLARRHIPLSGAAEDLEVCIDFLGCRARPHIRNTRHHLTKTSNYTSLLAVVARCWRHRTV